MSSKDADKSPPIGAPEPDVWRKSWQAGPPQPYLEAIGALVVNIAHAEEAIRMMFWRFSEMPIRNVQVVTAGARTSDIINWLKRLVDRDQENQVLVDELFSDLKEFEELKNERDWVSHRVWGTKDDGIGVLSNWSMVRDGNNIVEREYSLGELRGSAEKAFYLYQRLIRYQMTSEMYLQMPVQIREAFPLPWLDRFAPRDKKKKNQDQGKNRAKRPTP